MQPLPKQRRLRLKRGAADSSALVSLCAQIGAMPGVTAATLTGGALHIVYDLRQTDLAQIETHIRRAGLSLKDALRRALWRYAERNELANLNAPSSPCCNRPPPRR